MVAGRHTKTVLSKLRAPFTKQGTKHRAGEFIKKQVVHPGEAGSAAVSDTIGELPPACSYGGR